MFLIFSDVQQLAFGRGTADAVILEDELAKDPLRQERDQVIAAGVVGLRAASHAIYDPQLNDVSGKDLLEGFAEMNLKVLNALVADHDDELGHDLIDFFREVPDANELT